MELSLRAVRIEPSVTLAITAKAKEMKRSGIDVISFGVGEPDFNTPRNIMNKAIEAMENGFTKYTETNGIPSLREAICSKLREDNNLEYNINQIVISNGAKQCLANIFLAILNPEDEVIVPKPYWVSYPELIRLAGGIPIYVDSKREDDYKFTKENLEKVITDKSKAIVLNTPNNPTGVVYNKEELTEIANFAKENNLFIISDEIYEKLIYDDQEHISIASLSKDAYERTIVINGFSKSYAMTGWRVGYTASSKEVAKLITNVQSHMTSNVCSIAQYAAVEALIGEQDDIKLMVKEFDKRRVFMINALKEMKDIDILTPKGAFYIMVDLNKFIGKSINGNIIDNTVTFASLLLEEEKVAVVPGEAFGLDNYIRLSYATSLDNIKEGLKRIKEFTIKLV